jgi:DNA-binding transcriptional LysR family regulator
MGSFRNLFFVYENVMDDWNLYRTFLAVARGGTLAAGAESSGSSISTVHRQLAQLEAALGVRLFERRGRGQALTSAGEDLAVRVTRLEDEMHAIDRDIAGRDTALRGVVVLTTTDTIADALLGRYLGDLRERYPDIHVHVLVDNRHYRLGRGEADIALRPGARPREPDVIPHKAGEIRCSWYASDDYVARRGRPHRKADLRSHDAVVVDDSLAHIVYGRMAARYTDPQRWVLRSPSLAVQAMAVRRGVGVAALPCFLLDPDPDVTRLFTPEVEGPLWLLYHADLRRTARVRAVVDLLLESLERDRPRLLGRV